VETLGINAVTAQAFWRLPRSLPPALAAALPAGWEVVICETAAELPALVQRSAAVMGWPFAAPMARRAERLRWVHFFTSGIPESWLKIAAQGGPVAVTSAEGLNAHSVAEHGLFLALAALRGLKRESFAPGRWDPDAAFEVARAPGELTAGVVGHGAVGQRLSLLLRPLFGEVRVLTRTARPGVQTFADADSFFAACDFLFLAVPLVAETRALFHSPRFIAALRPRACIVNLARGELVDEPAMLRFLEENPGARYLADVAHPEPYPEGMPLWRSPRVLLTPHVAGRREDMWRRLEAQAVELARARLAGAA